MKRIHVAAIALVLLATPMLTGCFSGKGATTNMQATMNSGNGVSAQAGAIKAENAILVLGPEGSKTATLLVRIVNTGPVPDALTSAKINGVPAYVTGDSTDLGSGVSLSFGFESDRWINAYDFDAAVSTYVPVELTFTDAGILPMSILTVPAVGYYEGIAPNPATAPVPAG